MEGVKKSVSQKKLALESLASQGLLTKNPTVREKAIATLKIRPKSPELGFNGSSRRTRRRRHTRKTRKGGRSRKP